ncbi:substrate-binding domain-containing protein [Verrucomicrobiaceae bacterium N1E253]|uniref:Substrate-binding domain-containing protein n=1 Tax=Oceaniferula marina TaxID=2748318 RepID=A0A851GLZ1_9BACT|nr:substrate-binding domain-containing protein [Oceaniferula marina]NWK56175.1 substrate-binding domain-containing protein [Oceaniferula marina]
MKLALALRRSTALRFPVELGIHDYLRDHSEIDVVSVNGTSSLSWKDALSCDPDALIGFLHQPEHVQQLTNMNIPSVCINSIFDHQHVSCVRSDAYAVGVMAANHFLNLQCEDYTFISDVPNHHYSERRQAGFNDTLKTHGIRANCISSNSLDPAVLWLKKKLADKTRSAVFCVNDLTARALLNLLEPRHPDLEDHLILLGVDNDPFYYDNGAVIFSSIDVNHRQVGYQAAQLVHQQYREKTSPPRCIEIPPLQLVNRYRQAQRLQSRHPAVSQALQIIASEYASPDLTPETLAAKCAISVRSLNRSLKTHDYPPLSRCILNARMRAAKELIERSNLTLEQVAFTVGYREYTTFFRAFKKHEGLAPSSYHESP